MEKTGMIGCWSRDPGLVSNHITNIETIINWIWKIPNVVLPRVWGISVNWKIVSTESRAIERRDMINKNNMSLPIPPSNHTYLR